MRLLVTLFGCLLVIQLGSANWMFDVFEEVKEGVQEGMKDALDKTNVDEKFKAGVEEHLSGGAKNWKKLSNKVKDIFNEVKPKVYSAPMLNLGHLHRFKWGEKDLKKQGESFFEKAMKSATDFSEAQSEAAVDVPEVDEESGLEVEGKHHHGKHGRHHGKHGRHHGKHHKKHGGHHGGHHGHRHHHRHPHHGPQQANETMETFHQRLREAFAKDNVTANNPFRNSWQSIVKHIQGSLSGGSWNKIHKHVKSVIKEIKQEAKNVSKLARVPLHRMDWNEHRIQKLEKVFSKLADKWGDAMKNAFDEPKASSVETEEEKPVTAEELAFVDEPKTLEEKKSLIKLVAATEPELEYGLEKADTTEKKMSELESEWEKRVEKEEEEFTKEILKDHDDEEDKPEEKTPGFPVHEGVVVAAPDEVETATKAESEDDDVDFLPMAPVELTDLGTSEIESVRKETKPETYSSYLGTPAKIFRVGESAENAEKMLKDEEKIFFKKLAEERKEWLEMKETLLEKLARMGKHQKQ